MSKRTIIMLFAMIAIASAGLFVVTSHSESVDRAASPEGIQPAGSVPGIADVRVLESLMNARPAIDLAALTTSDGAPAGDKPAVTVDVDDVARRASFIYRPYESAEEKRDVLERLEETAELFDRMIDTTVNNIDKARSDGSRTAAEISEATEALAEMKKGRQFISSRITMVQNDEFSQ